MMKLVGLTVGTVSCIWWSRVFCSVPSCGVLLEVLLLILLQVASDLCSKIELIGRFYPI